MDFFSVKLFNDLLITVFHCFLEFFLKFLVKDVTLKQDLLECIVYRLDLERTIHRNYSWLHVADELLIISRLFFLLLDLFQAEVVAHKNNTKEAEGRNLNAELVAYIFEKHFKQFSIVTAFWNTKT